MPHIITKRIQRQLPGPGWAVPKTAVFGSVEILGEEHPGAYCAVRMGDTFHAVPVRRDDSGAHERGKEEYSQVAPHYGLIYSPIAEGTTFEDVEGATFAHDDGEVWHIAHCSPGQQHDFAADAETFARSQFDAAIQAAIAKGALADANAARNTAYAKATALIDFAKGVGRAVHAEVVGETLGHFHRNPHADHRRALAVRAINRALVTLRQNAAADADSRHKLARVSDAASAALVLLTPAAKIETQAERVARFWRLSARGQDPLGGREYIYASSVTGEAITGLANLPDASWKFDAAALKKGIRRGGYVYWDGYPLDLTIGRPFAIRFHRPAAGGAWTQDPAIRIYGGFSSD